MYLYAAAKPSPYTKTIFPTVVRAPALLKKLLTAMRDEAELWLPMAEKSSFYPFQILGRPTFCFPNITLENVADSNNTLGGTFTELYNILQASIAQAFEALPLYHRQLPLPGFLVVHGDEHGRFERPPQPEHAAIESLRRLQPTLAPRFSHFYSFLLWMPGAHLSRESPGIERDAQEGEVTVSYIHQKFHLQPFQLHLFSNQIPHALEIATLRQKSVILWAGYISHVDGRWYLHW